MLGEFRLMEAPGCRTGCKTRICPSVPCGSALARDGALRVKRLRAQARSHRRLQSATGDQMRFAAGAGPGSAADPGTSYDGGSPTDGSSGMQNGMQNTHLPKRPVWERACARWGFTIEAPSRASVLPQNRISATRCPDTATVPARRSRSRAAPDARAARAARRRAASPCRPARVRAPLRARPTMPDGAMHRPVRG